MAGPLLRSLWSNTTRRRSFSSQSHLKFVQSLSFLRAFSVAAGAPNRLRNVAVIAHVDHGKTTLMDRLLRQCGADIPASIRRKEQLDFPVLYASAKEGWASSTFTKEPPADARNMSQLLDAVVKHVPPPKADLDAPFLMLVSMMEKDFYLGRILTGRVSSGVVRVGDKVTGLRNTDSGSVKIEEGKVVKLMKKKGTTIVSIDAAGAGDIICMAGLTTPSIGHTVASTEVTTALPSVELDPPTISMTFGVNDSPLAGRDGTQLTGGELQLGILIENMRREGFELSVSPPKVM
ncbi:hypothetical protein F2Q70_00008196 [Brassica cretica]|uniref:Tr-type G domain-containing protein n=1 Tax=Brassica cretica TaxID=69181 RepID=A0A8S9M1V8_BRACR|nr:hypothetical protein F2Q70_00008196 [Brassica cretica]